MSSDGTPKLADFGMAKIVDRATMTALTRTGDLLGTFTYIPPEVFRGEPVGEPGDVYQLGLLLYILLTGSHPLENSTSSDLLCGRAFERITPPSSRAPGIGEAVTSGIGPQLS